MEYQLRELRQKDAPLMLEWMHDSEVVGSLGTDFAKKTLEDAQAFITWANQLDGEEIHLACVDNKDEYLGTVSLKHIDQEHKNAEYAICFRRCAHGTGAAHYATAAIQKTAFQKLGLEKIYLYLYSVNERANRFYQKEGFVLEGRQRSQVWYQGAFVDKLWYGVTREHWLAEQGR